LAHSLDVWNNCQSLLRTLSQEDIERKGAWARRATMVRTNHDGGTYKQSSLYQLVLLSLRGDFAKTLLAKV